MVFSAKLALEMPIKKTLKLISSRIDWSVTEGAYASEAVANVHGLSYMCSRNTECPVPRSSIAFLILKKCVL